LDGSAMPVGEADKGYSSSCRRTLFNDEWRGQA